MLSTHNMNDGTEAGVFRFQANKGKCEWEPSEEPSKWRGACATARMEAVIIPISYANCLRIKSPLQECRVLFWERYPHGKFTWNPRTLITWEVVQQVTDWQQVRLWGEVGQELPARTSMVDKLNQMQCHNGRALLTPVADVVITLDTWGAT